MKYLTCKFLADTRINRFFSHSHAFAISSSGSADTQPTEKAGLKTARSNGTIHNILAWSGICLVLVLAIWGFTLLKLAHEKSQITKDALKDAFYLSQSYAEQLDRSIAQVDQITSQLRYVWTKTGGSIDLERRLDEGLISLMPGSQAWIADTDGRIITSTSRPDINRNIANHPCFTLLRDGKVRGLYISDPMQNRQTGDTVIHFARKLEAEDGSFDGVVVVAITPRYLESFTSELALGENDSLTLKKTDGTLLASKRGDNIRDVPTIYRAPSTFSKDNGVERVPASTFIDEVPRIVAWHKLKNYPLVSIVNEAENDVFAGYLERENDYKGFAAVSSLILFALALVGINFSNRLERKRKLDEEIKQTYRLATEAAREGFFTVKPVYAEDGNIEDFAIEDCNDRGAAFLGLGREQAIGTRLSILYPLFGVQQIFNVCISALQDGYFEDEMKLPSRRRDGKLWVHRRIVKSGNGLAVTLRDISEAKAHQYELTRQANTDKLTSLPNRHWLMSYLPFALERAQKNLSMLAILFIDLDDFKIINDTQGHAAGDELLIAVATRLKGVLKSNDSVVRIGGDEFMVISEGHQSGENVSPLAQCIIAALSEPFSAKSGQFHTIGASIGISVYQEDGLDCETLIKHADIAMYAAKSEGKNRYQFYRAQLSERLVARLDIVRAMRASIKRDEFFLHYQPRVHAKTGQVHSMEALLRWRHPERGPVAPAEFIPFAEETGLIIDLGTMVIHKVCAQIAQWQAAGIPIVPISINVSAQQTNRGNLALILQESLDRYDIAPSFLEVELTESCMIDHASPILDQIAAIKAMGIAISIDDFGTGYSSMSQLQRLDLDVLKIDRLFTHALTEGREGEAFFKAMISMAHALDMRVVAEGVETEAQLRMLQELSCDDVQGYYISHPVKAQEVPELLSRGSLLPQG